MIVSLIAAVSDNYVIGDNDKLVWHLPDDMAYFKRITMGHHVLMGRKNFFSIPEKYRPLPGRTNIIVSRQKHFSQKNCVVAPSIEAGISFAKSRGEKEIFIIGGGEIFRQSVDLAERMYITWVHGRFEGNVYFPKVDLHNWRLTDERDHPADSRHAHAFSLCVYEKINRS